LRRGNLKKDLILSIVLTVVGLGSLCLDKPSLIKYGPPLLEKWFLVIILLYTWFEIKGLIKFSDFLENLLNVFLENKVWKVWYGSGKLFDLS